MKPLRFIVEGSGNFPYDMLRYDCCWPEHESGPRSSSQMGNFEELGRDTTRQVTLLTDTRCTPRRWESFGWKVVAQMPGDYDENEYIRKAWRQEP